MKKWMTTAVAALTVWGCMPEFEDPHLGVRGLTKEDVNAPPGATEIKAAIVNDARNRRALRYFLDDGQRSSPTELKLDKYGQQAVRSKDGVALWRVEVWEDPPEQRHAVMETAYWDNEHSIYYYHYEGGNPHRDVWMGPYGVKFSKRGTDDDGHGH